MDGTDYVASCGKCGVDFAYGTSRERNDWLREHDPEHRDFVSFFRQVRGVKTVSELDGWVAVELRSERPAPVPLGTAENRSERLSGPSLWSSNPVDGPQSAPPSPIGMEESPMSESYHDQDDVIGFCPDMRHPWGCQDDSGHTPSGLDEFHPSTTLNPEA